MGTLEDWCGTSQGGTAQPEQGPVVIQHERHIFPLTWENSCGVTLPSGPC